MKETDLRYVKTERAIRDAFFELLEESEFDKVSVTDITQRAQINRNIEPYLDIAAITDVIADHIGKNKFLDFRSQRSSVSKSFLAFGFFGALNDYCSNDYTKEETVRMISAMSAGLAEIAQQLHAAGNKVGNGNKSNK